MTATTTASPFPSHPTLDSANYAIRKTTISSVAGSTSRNYDDNMKGCIRHQNGSHMLERGGGYLLNMIEMRHPTPTSQWTTTTRSHRPNHSLIFYGQLVL